MHYQPQQHKHKNNHTKIQVWSSETRVLVLRCCFYSLGLSLELQSPGLVRGLEACILGFGLDD